MAVPMLKRGAFPKRAIADKANDADRLRRWLAKQRITAVIPSEPAHATRRPTILPTLAA